MQAPYRRQHKIRFEPLPLCPSEEMVATQNEIEVSSFADEKDKDLEAH